MKHVAVHRKVYKGFNNSASHHVGVCFTKAKAECWKSVINGPLRAAYLAHNHTRNLAIDDFYRGNEIPAAQMAEDSAWDSLTQEEEKCDQMQ